MTLNFGLCARRAAVMSEAKGKWANLELYDWLKVYL